ncbi:MAG: adenosylcobinamide-GDP ribazoletransferase [Prevotella sp.]|nr:adenosylcobinamide-GDP ribazoletransferase [Prevotella sp.]
MRISLNTSKWWQNAWAALLFFTRLPLWRIYQPPKDSYKAVVEFWPLVGWLTGGAMAATLYFGSMLFPYPIAVLLAITLRLLLTGALHEDGLADFCDGFGGGKDRQRILDIMKDSHIGTYGVIGLIVYFALLFTALVSLSPKMAALTILAADPFAKMVAGQIVQMMPYARTEESAKANVVYRKITLSSAIALAFQGLLPLVPFMYSFGADIQWEYIIFIPCLTMYGLYLLIWHRLRGYTGDCCGALCLLIELTFYIVVATVSFQG